MNRTFTILLSIILTLAFACGDDGTADTGTADTGTADTGTSDTGTTDTGTSDTGTSDTGTADTGDVDGGAMVHGCTAATAMDMTGMGAVTISDVSAWSLPHSACIRVSEGTTVTWEGNFVAHPLVGGVSPTTDATSPITLATAVGMSTDVTFATAGDFPYFCMIHTGAMRGVVYVVP